MCNTHNITFAASGISRVSLYIGPKLWCPIFSMQHGAMLSQFIRAVLVIVHYGFEVKKNQTIYRTLNQFMFFISALIFHFE